MFSAGHVMSFAMFRDDHRVAVQLSKPLYQSLNGPQLETDWVLQLTWAVTF